MNHQPSVLIVSVYLSTNSSLDNITNHDTAKAALDALGVGYIELLGSYRGVVEKSLLIDSSHKRVVEILARDYKQESYLLLESDRFASLVFGDGTTVGLGYLHGVSRSEAMGLEAWSYRADLDQFYAVTA